MAALQCSHKAATTAVEATETAAAAVAIDTAWLCSVAARHTPAFFIHPRDTFMPCSAEFFLQHSELRQAMPAAAAAAAAAAPATVVVLPRGGVTAPLLLQAQRRMPAGGRQWLELDPAARVGTPRDRLDEDAPVYCRAKAVVAGARPGHGSGGRMLEAIELTYLTLYAFNGPYNVGGWSALQTGQHDGDWEHITARVHPTSGDLLGMWYNAHRSRDGCWVAGHEVPRDPATGRPAAYVALHGHGVYPQPARHLRHFFLGNDLCSAAGLTWRPRRVLLLPGATATEASADIGELEDEGQAASRGDGASPAAAAATAADPTYCLPHVPSRGSLLAGVSSYSNSDAGGGAGVRRASGSATGAVATYSESGSGTHGLPQVVTDNPCAWVWFRGDWGTTPAPIEQAWMHRAEPPISRSLLLRIFGHFWPEPR